MKFDSIVSKIESLPPLSDTTILIQQLYTEGAENIDIIKLVKIIESDAFLTANILKMINAPLYGFSRKITSILQSVTLFGTRMIYGLVLNYAINEKLKANIRAYRLSNSQFNDMCHIQSALMMQWLSEINLEHAQFLSPLALIMESGKLILAKEITDSGVIKEFKEGLLTCDNIEEYEHELTTTTSYYLSGLLFDYWNLEPLYGEMLKGLDFNDENMSSQMKYYRDALDVVRTAINVKEVLTKRSIINASVIVEHMGLDGKHFENIALKVKGIYLQSLEPISFK